MIAEPPSNALTHPKYRADVDGLRAVAVLAIVAFHAYPNYLARNLLGPIILKASGKELAARNSTAY
jgi:peptidoglycan/LPS O-acetylase OafA/YrhL